MRMLELLSRKKDRAKPFVLVIDDDEDIRGLITTMICRAIKDDGGIGKTPVVMVTALDQHKDMETALANGADGYVVKPLDHQKFKKKALELLKLLPPSAS